MWYVPVVLRILVANGLAAWMLKRTVGLHSRTTRLFLQFLFCAVLAILLALSTQSFVLNGITLLVVGIGVLNSIAAYCQWRAMDISLSKTSLFTFWDDFIAMGMSFIILGEGRYLNIMTTIGVLLSSVAVVLFTLYNYKKRQGGAHVQQAGAATSFTGSFYVYVLSYSVIWGVAMFMHRYAGLEQIQTPTFLSAWYVGSVVGASGIMILSRYVTPAAPPVQKLSPREFRWLFLLSIVIMMSLGLGYMAYQAAPQNIVQPFFMVGEMVVPSLIGLYLFHERKEIDTKEKILFALALVGGLIVALSFKPF